MAADPNHQSAVSLLAMPAHQFTSWCNQLTKAYAADKVRSGNWPALGAQERAIREMQELLPQGLSTPGHRFWLIVPKDSTQTVGSLWVKIDNPVAPGDVFIYDILVDETQRGHGYGSAALQELARVMRAEGAARLLLHVFGFNQGAQRLYARLGFQVTNVNMALSL